MNDLFLNIDLPHFLLLAIVVFSIGLIGVIFNRKSVIHIVLCIELMLLGVNINMLAFSAYFKEMTGQIFTIFILTVAAAEASVGLAIIINYYRKKASIDINDINEMQG